MKFHCGLFLFVSQKPDYKESLPMTDLEVEAVVIDQACEVRLSHTFMHERPTPVEAVFSFPLIENAAVCGFDAQIEGRRVVGMAKEKNEARQDYEAAKSRGDGAYLLDQERVDVFTASLGNVPPRTPVIIRTTYVCELASEGDALRFMLPTTIAPRYDTSRSGTSSSRLRFRATFVMGSRVISLTSPSHPAFGISLDDRRAVVTGEEHVLDRDLILLAELTDAHAPRAICERSATVGSTSCAVQLSLFPKVQLRDTLCEVIFLVDRSGSMSTENRMGNAVEALTLFVRSLPAGCKFNIVSFGSGHSSLFPAPRAYAQDTLDLAIAHIQRMSADMGGTELLEPMRTVLRGPVEKGFHRQVFILTDGQIDSMDATLSLAREACAKGSSRLFALGLGRDVSHMLIDGLARAGRGTAEYVGDGERPNAKVLRQLRTALQPELSNVRVKWGDKYLEAEAASAPAPTTPAPGTPAMGSIVGSLLGFTSSDAHLPAPVPLRPAQQAPRAVPPLISMQPFVIYALFPDPARVPEHVTIEAETSEGKLDATVRVIQSAAPGKLLHTLAARKLIRDWEESKSAGARAEIVRLGCEFGLSSSATSFVAIEDRHIRTPQFEVHADRLLSSTLTTTSSSSSMMASRKSGAAPKAMAFMSMSPSAPPPAPQSQAAPMPAGRLRQNSSEKKKKEKSDGRGGAAPAMRMRDSRASEISMEKEEEAKCACDDEGESDFVDSGVSLAMDKKFNELVACQKFDGSFEGGEKLARAVGLAGGDVAKARPQGVEEAVWAVLVAIAAFKRRYPERRDEWELLVTKSVEWLNKKQPGVMQHESAALALFK